MPVKLLRRLHALHFFLLVLAQNSLRSRRHCYVYFIFYFSPRYVFNIQLALLLLLLLLLLFGLGEVPCGEEEL
jgi:hypothetical protein